MKARWLGWVLAGCAVTAAAAGVQMFDQQTVAVGGHPFGVAFSPDGRFLFAGTRDQRGSALDVLGVGDDGRWKKVGTIPLGNTNLQGILPIPGMALLAMGLGEQGIGMLPLAAAEKATGTLQILPMGKGFSAGLLSVSADGKMLYAGDEYGNGGQVTAVTLHVDAEHKVHAEIAGHVLTPRTNAGVFVSPDGRRAYATTEVVPPPLAAGFEGHGNDALDRNGCTQGGPRSMPGGGLYVIDTATQKVAAKLLAGCSPVRDLTSPDGRVLYINARGDNELLAFDAGKIESDPKHAFLWAAKTGGTAPVGIALFDNGTKMLVANSNRFSPGSPGTITALDLQAAGGPKVVETIKTGDFPRNIDTAADGHTLAVTIFGSNEVVVLHQR